MDCSHLTKEEILEGIKKETVYFESLSEKWRDNKDIVLNAIKQNGWALSLASERLKNNKKIVLEAIKERGTLLYYASDRLKDNKKIVLEAIKERGTSLYYASDRLKDDKNLLEILEKKDISHWHVEYKKWYEERMALLNILKSQEDKEFMEDSITVSNKKTKKLKF